MATPAASTRTEVTNGQITHPVSKDASILIKLTDQLAFNGLKAKIYSQTGSNNATYVTVGMPNKTTPYSIVLCNNYSEDADVTVSVDGKEIGDYRVKRYGNAEVDRPTEEDRQLIFVPVDSADAVGAGVASTNPNNGVVVTTWKFGTKKEPLHVVYRGGFPEPFSFGGQAVAAGIQNECSTFGMAGGASTLGATRGATRGAGLSAGATVLGKRTGHQMRYVEPINEDTARTFKIMWRMVVDHTITLNPHLTAVASWTPPTMDVPPPIPIQTPTMGIAPV